MSNQGWISIYRKIQDNFLWFDKPFAKGQAWIDMMLLANHQESKFLSKNEIISLERGSFATSDEKLGLRWGWKRKKVRLFLQMLEEEQMIVTKRNNKGTVITLVNYGLYQDSGFEKEHQRNIKGTSKEHQRNIGGTSKEHQRNTNNNVNNNNNDNNDNNDNTLSLSASQKLSENSIEYKLSKYMESQFQRYVRADFKVQNFFSWSKTMRQIINKYDEYEAWAMIDCICSDEFWSTRCTNPAAMLKNFDTMKVNFGSKFDKRLAETHLIKEREEREERGD